MRKLEKLNIVRGSIQPASTTQARIHPFTLSITLLSLFDVTIPSPIDPSSLSLVRSLHLYFQACQPIRLLLPQLDSLSFQTFVTRRDFNLSIQESTSITSLSFNETRIVDLDDASKTLIKESIVDFRLLASVHNDSGDSTLTTIIAGSKAMKKVTLDGRQLSLAHQGHPKFLSTLKVVKEGCKKKEIELWKENFEVGNGKVDFEK
jgi:hypothetical protein